MIKSFYLPTWLYAFAGAAIIAAGTWTVPIAVADSLDPFERLFNPQEEEIIPDSDKSSDELLADANALFQDEKPLEGRTKVLAALKKDPKNYRAMMLMSGYYMQHVGHFKLSLRYVLRGLELFEEKHGPPPYVEYLARAEHQQLLYLLSQARLNLDDYQGSLDVLDTYVSYGYFDDWYAGSRSWTLMKLGRLDEAIKIARLAAVAGTEQGRILNMLGILLSLKNERLQSLDVFKQAIAYELSLGRNGQPGTPLNNSAEVLKELFEDGRAEAAWLRTLRLPDGCDHVLPALNLALLSIEAGKYPQATQAIKSFEECNAQFPLRNGEEHRALVALARGRIALRTGHPEKALELFEDAKRSRQWFGKIGTSQLDMQAATLQSLSQALTARANWLRFTPTKSWSETLQNHTTAVSYDLRSWWIRRKATKLLGGQLSDFEDFETRFTDSLLEYSTLGAVVQGYPPAAVTKKIELTEQIDDRAMARPYYEAYLGESQLAHGSVSDGLETLERAASQLRDLTDVGLKNHIRTLRLKRLEPGTPDYLSLALELYRDNPAWLKNAGLVLPVSIVSFDTQQMKSLLQAGFLEDPASPLLVTGFTDGSVQLQDRGQDRGQGRGQQIRSAKSIEELGVKTFQKEG